MVEREGPWPLEEVDVDVSGALPWHGGPPAIERIEPDAAPGGLVFVLHRDGVEVDRAPIIAGGEDPAVAAARHAEMALADPSLRVLIFDGDSGRPIVSLAGPEALT